MSPAAILFGAGFTGITILCIGALITQALRLRLNRAEQVLLGYLLGSAALSTAVFLLLAAHIARPWSFAAVGGAAIVMFLWQRPWRGSQRRPAALLSTWWRILFGGAVLVYGVYTFVHAMAPEVSPDGSSYHLGTVGRYFREGGFSSYTGSMYSLMPMGIEMLFLFAYAFGRHSAAALVHWQFLFLLPFLLLALGKRFGCAKAGALAGIIVFVSPVFGIDGASAYIDVGTAAVAFGLFSTLMIWEQQKDRGLLIAAGTLAGFCYVCKLTAAPAIGLALLFTAWKLWRAHAFSLRLMARVAVPALAVITPWVIRTTVLTGNPFSPFLNRYFPNPYVRVSFEEEYRANYRTYYGVIKSPSEIPREVIVRGGILNGLLGPVFFLAPLGLLALRWPLGRRALLAALLFFTTYPANIGTRFLISTAPFVALAMSLVIARWRGMATMVAAFHLFLSWPAVILSYSDQYAWRLDRFLLREALRKESEGAYLSRTLPGYMLARIAEQAVPANGRIFTFGGIPRAYTSRDIEIGYESGVNNAAGEMLTSAVAPDMAGTKSIDFRFVARRTRRLRLIQTARTPQIWSVSELRILTPEGTEVPRAPSWHIRANPDPWDVQWAFDNCPITRWKAWQASEPGEYIEVEFPEPLTIGGVRVETSLDHEETAVQLEVEGENGKWEKAGGEAQSGSLPPRPDLRRIATDDLTRLGFTHLMATKTEFLSDQFAKDPDAWGMELIAESAEGRLYQLKPLSR